MPSDLTQSHPESIQKDRSVVETALHSAAYTFAQTPLQAMAQISDKVVDTDLQSKLTFMEPPEHTEFGSAKWHAQQIGSAVGMAPWVYAIHRTTGGKATRVAGTEVVKEGLTLGQHASHAALTGAIYGGIFTPSADASTFIQDRLRNAAVGATAFAAMSSTAHGLRLAGLESRATAGILSGVTGGVAHAESLSLLSGKGHASTKDIIQDAYAFGAMGGVLGLTSDISSRFRPPTPQAAPASNRSDIFDTTAKEPIADRLNSAVRSLADRVSRPTLSLGFATAGSESGFKSIKPFETTYTRQISALPGVMMNSRLDGAQSPSNSNSNTTNESRTPKDQTSTQVRVKRDTQTIPEGSKITEHNRGELEVKFPDGTEQRRYPSQGGYEIVTRMPDGTVIETKPDGSYQETPATGPIEKIQYEARSNRITNFYRSGSISGAQALEKPLAPPEPAEIEARVRPRAEAPTKPAPEFWEVWKGNMEKFPTIEGTKFVELGENCRDCYLPDGSHMRITETPSSEYRVGVTEVTKVFPDGRTVKGKQYHCGWEPNDIYAGDVEVGGMSWRSENRPSRLWSEPEFNFTERSKEGKVLAKVRGSGVMPHLRQIGWKITPPPAKPD